MWIPTIFLNLQQTSQQMIDFFSGDLPTNGPFCFPEEFPDASADFLPIRSEGDDGIFPVTVRLVTVDQAVVFHLS